MIQTPVSPYQAKPIGNTLTDLATIAADSQFVASSLLVCNTGGTPATFRISLAVAGAADALSQYIYRDVPIAPADTFVATIGLTLAATDKVRVWSSNANLTFTLCGVRVQ